jgi:hypothetical protein
LLSVVVMWVKVARFFVEWQVQDEQGEKATGSGGVWPAFTMKWRVFTTAGEGAATARKAVGMGASWESGKNKVGR